MSVHFIFHQLIYSTYGDLELIMCLCRYHGEKLSSFLPLKKPKKEFHISTIYDKPKDIDKGDDLLRRQPNTSMKYRDWQPGGSTR